MPDTIRLTSHLPITSRRALEALLFFNVRQHALRAQIEATIERFGIPEVVEQGGSLRVAVGGLPELQCLYAVRGDNDEPVGAVVYTRDAVDRITVVHLSVASDAALCMDGGGRLVLHRLLGRIHRVARCTAGIRHVELAYRARRAPRAVPAYA